MLKKEDSENTYYVEQGKMVEYMIDYETGNNESMQLFQNEYGHSPLTADEDENRQKEIEKYIHSDNIGEYKSEFVKITFDKTSSKVKNIDPALNENRDIKKIDLNQLGMFTHILRQGEYEEKVFYGCKIIESKKVFTIRTQYQLVNYTGFDYLVYFKF